MVSTTRPPFGELLRSWRRQRGFSQLDLSLQADVSSRHLSFIESGRSRPSREMVLHLGRVLQVPLRESNDLLLAAGFAPVHTETALDATTMQAANAAIDLVLSHQEPFPAVVMDRRWNLLRANDAAQRFFTRLLGARDDSQPNNVVRLVLAADGLRPWLTNWREVALGLGERVRREAVGGVIDAFTRGLLDELAAATASTTAEAAPAAEWPLVPLRFKKQDLELNFFSMVTTLGTPRDIALQELRIECFFPADERTRQRAAASY